MEIIIVSGLPGTGKSTVISRLFNNKNIICLSNDETRKKILANDIYSGEIAEFCYTYSLGAIFKYYSNYSVIVLDAVYFKKNLRMEVENVAKTLSLKFSTLVCECSWKLSINRINKRQYGRFKGITSKHMKTMRFLKNNWEKYDRKNEYYYNSELNLFYTYSTSNSLRERFPIFSVYENIDNELSPPDFIVNYIDFLKNHIISRVKNKKTYSLYLVGSLSSGELSYSHIDDSYLLFSDIDFLLIVDTIDESIINLQKELVFLREKSIGFSKGFHIGLKTRTLAEFYNMGAVETSAYNSCKTFISKKGQGFPNYCNRIYTYDEIKKDMWKYFLTVLHAYFLYGLYFYGSDKNDVLRCYYQKAKIFIIFYKIYLVMSNLLSNKVLFPLSYKKCMIICKKIKNNNKSVEDSTEVIDDNFLLIIDDILFLFNKIGVKLTSIESDYFYLAKNYNFNNIKNKKIEFKRIFIKILKNRFSENYAEYRDHIDLYASLLSVKKNKLDCYVQ